MRVDGDAGMESVPGAVIGGGVFARYREFSLLGEGGVGRVESCEDPDLQRPVAIKCLHEPLENHALSRTRLIREARVLARVAHPNVMPVYELGTKPDGAVYFAMKQVDGSTLQEVLKSIRDGRPSALDAYPRAELIRVFVDICQAVAYAHGRGIVHRDLKPANVLIGEFGEVLVLDWGMAKVLDEDEEEDFDFLAGDVDLDTQRGGTTIEGTVFGTLDYMAPEQARGEVSSHDERTDIYALGGMLYEILTWLGTTRKLVMRDILEEIKHAEIQPPREAVRQTFRRRRAADRPPDVPRELNAICMKALAKQRENRYASVQALIHDVRCWQNDQPVSVCPDSLVRKAWKWCKRHPLVAVSVTTGLVVFLVSAATVFTVRASHFRTMVDAGDQHRQAGSERFDKALGVVGRLLALPAGATDEADGLQGELAKIHGVVEAEYQIAVVLYAGAGRGINDMRLREQLREIFSNRINFALLTGNRHEAAKWLRFLEPWMGVDFSSALPAQRERLRSIAVWARGDVEVDAREMLLLNAGQRQTLGLRE